MNSPDPIKNLRDVAIGAGRLADQLGKLRLMSVPDAARLLNISEWAVRRYLPIRKFGHRTTRVSLDDVEDFDKRRTVVAIAVKPK